MWFVKYFLRFDVSRTLLANEPCPRKEFAFIQSSATNNFGQIHALRLNEYKAHFYTEGNIFSSNEDLSCIGLRKVKKSSSNEDNVHEFIH